jgi:hypothetical protein
MNLLVLAKNAMNNGLDTTFALASGARRKLSPLVKLMNQYCSLNTSPHTGNSKGAEVNGTSGFARPGFFRIHA